MSDKEVIAEDMDKLAPILKYVSSDNPGVERIIVIALFLLALWWIVRQFSKLIKMHIDRMEQCNDAIHYNTKVVSQNTLQTARVADALNQISLRMPNYGCSMYNNQGEKKEVSQDV